MVDVLDAVDARVALSTQISSKVDSPSTLDSPIAAKAGFSFARPSSDVPGRGCSSRLEHDLAVRHR